MPHRRKSDALSVASSSDLFKYSGNPIDLWMESQLPKKESVVALFSSTIDSASSIKSGSLSALSEPQFVRRDFSDDISLGRGRGRGRENKKPRGRELEEGAVTGQELTQWTLQSGPQGALGGDNSPGSRVLGSGIDRCMDSYVFLVPIRVRRGWVTSVLSHWSMATLILIPEAHAFLALDSADKKSTSYLMTGMEQDHSTPDPTIRVRTCNNGTLYIRFETQSRLDAWMSLFDEEDLAALRPSLTSSFDQLPPQSDQLQPDGGGHGLDSNHEVDHPSLPVESHSSKQMTMSHGNLFSAASALVARAGARSIFKESNAEMSELQLPPVATVEGAEAAAAANRGQMRPWMNVATTAHSEYHHGGSRAYESDSTLLHPNISNSDSGNNSDAHGKSKNNNSNESDNSIASAGNNAPTIDPRSSRQNNNNRNPSVTDDNQILTTIPSIPSMPSSALPIPSVLPQKQPQLPLLPEQQQVQSSAFYGSLPFSSNIVTHNEYKYDYNDDDDDLYDPEFGIGGNGRRRFRHRSSASLAGSGSAFSSTTSSARSSMVFSSNTVRSLPTGVAPRSLENGAMANNVRQQQQHYQTAVMIPSAAVISTAAAACAAGWSESEALAAATADPSGSFLARLTLPQSPLTPGHGSGSNSRKSPTEKGSPGRKSFSDFRRTNNPINTGLSLLAAGGRRSLGQILPTHPLDRRVNRNSNPSAQTIPEDAIESINGSDSGVGNNDGKVLSYSQYLIQNQAARTAAAEAAAHQNRNQSQQPLPLQPPQEPAVMPTPATPVLQSSLMAIQATVSASVPSEIQTIQAPITVAPPLADDDESTPPQ
ncbi:hypothetical protein EC991_004968 [Linnemannia zychae]|nr:hypothetical protein EC991_004968 [Linnemannia zychae]